MCELGLGMGQCSNTVGMNVNSTHAGLYKLVLKDFLDTLLTLDAQTDWP